MLRVRILLLVKRAINCFVPPTIYPLRRLRRQQPPREICARTHPLLGRVAVVSIVRYASARIACSSVEFLRALKNAQHRLVCRPRLLRECKRVRTRTLWGRAAGGQIARFATALIA